MLGLKKTAGSILVVSTLILSILAGLSIATMQNVVTEYQLSTHDQDKTLALQSAQYALAEAKRLVLTQWAPGASPCATIGGCVNASGVPVSTNGVAVWSYAAFAGSSDFAQQAGSYFISNAQATANVPNGKVAQAPRFFVIDLGCDPYSKVNIYRLIAMGFGASVQTTAYAESQLTMPLSGQNSYRNAPTTAVYGVGVAASGMPTQYNYNLAASTNSKNLFFNSVAGSCSNPGQSNGSGATCERNCAGEVRVKAYSRYHSNSCTWVYGDWVSGTNQSTLTLNSDGSGGTTSLSCGPCQTAISVPVATCTSGQYNSCAGNCVVGCPPALPNKGSDGACYPACAPATNSKTVTWNPPTNSCRTCPTYNSWNIQYQGCLYDGPSHSPSGVCHAISRFTNNRLWTSYQVFTICPYENLNCDVNKLCILANAFMTTVPTCKNYPNFSNQKYPYNPANYDPTQGGQCFAASNYPY